MNDSYQSISSNTYKTQDLTKSQNGRTEYLDMLKCLGMFIVVSGHIHSDFGWFSLPLHSFVIPLYFLLSGMTFRRNKFANVWDFIKHRAKTLLFPYVLLSLLTWFLWAVFHYATKSGVNIWKPLLQTFIAQGPEGFLVHNMPLWFITCLFIVELMYYYISKLPKKVNILTCIICTLIGIWMTCGQYSKSLTMLPWSIESAFASVIFYCVGNLLKEHWGLEGIQKIVLSKKTLSILLIIVLTCVLVFTSHWNGRISLGSNLMGRNPFLLYVNAFIGICSIMLFAILICSIECKSKFILSIKSFHLWFGKNSFFILATHFPIQDVLVRTTAKLLHTSYISVRNDYLLFALIFIATCALSSVCAIYIGKLKKHDEAVFDKIKH